MAGETVLFSKTWKSSLMADNHWKFALKAGKVHFGCRIVFDHNTDELCEVNAVFDQKLFAGCLKSFLRKGRAQLQEGHNYICFRRSPSGISIMVDDKSVSVSVECEEIPASVPQTLRANAP